MYDLPQFDFNDFKNKASKILNNKFLQGAVLVIIILVAVGFLTGKISVNNIQNWTDSIFQKTENNLLEPLAEKPAEKYISKIEYEQAIIDTVKEASPSVVSIVISKNVPVYEQQPVNPFGDNSPFDILVPKQVQKGTKKQEVGAGSGFIVSEDGLILTNKHVVSDKKADYTVITSNGKKYSAKVLALDPVHDLAIIKIQAIVIIPERTEKFLTIKLGDSSLIQIGQGAIAIGNALGEFRNTASVGIISGLGRTILASDGQGFSETLEGVIQTDAAINQGNSGGPLLNLRGEVIGVNTAMAQGGQSIGFAIPINIAKRDIDQVTKINKIVYPFLGVRHILVNDAVKEKYKLSVDYGAIILKGDNGTKAIAKDSAAEKAGLKEKDVILELNGEKISQDNSLSKIIQKYNPGDKVTLKILRIGKEILVDVILGERS